jgi:predicted transcriptional regulator YdeE
VVRPVPAARYIAARTPVKEIAATAEYLFGEWLPASPYDYAAPLCDLEIYPPDTEKPDSPVWVCVPIREKVAVMAKT